MTKKKTQIIKIRNESRDITTDFTEIKRIIFCERLYANELENLDEVDKLLEIHKLGFPALWNPLPHNGNSKKKKRNTQTIKTKTRRN